MSWQDPNGPWARKMRRRIRLQSLLALFAFAATLVFLGFLWYMDSTIRGVAGESLLFEGWLGVLLISPVLVQVVPAVLLLRRVRIDRRLLTRVPRYDGLLCPSCRTSLADLPPEGSCPTCRKRYSHADTREYWGQYVLSVFVVRPWPAQRRRNPLIRFREAMQNNIAVAVTWVIVIWLMALIFVWWFTGGSFLGVLLREGTWYLAMACSCLGFIFLRHYRKRFGETRHCATCDYQQAPNGQISERCPECGAVWAGPGGTVVGKHVRRPEMLWTAVLLFTFGGLLFGASTYSTLSRSGWQLKPLPTSALIHDIVTSRGSTDAEWAELRRRQLTPEQKCMLATGLLDKRLARAHLWFDAGNWLVRQLTANTLPPEIVERFYREMLAVWIKGPERVRLGETARVSIGCELRRIHGIPSRTDEFVYFSGFYVGNGTEPLARQDQAHYAGLLDEPGYTPSAEVTAQELGPLRISVVYWFVIGPSSAGGQIKWRDDGTPVIPSTAEWAERIEVEHVVQILE